LEDSGLRVASVAADQALLGRVSRYLTTFLKAGSGWERWGNWSEGTPFPIREMRQAGRAWPGREGRRAGSSSKA